jgi:8-oxo-dGTP diphosphatase
VIPTHAGGVVVSHRGAELVFLIVRASRPPYEWVIPKGHLEERETLEEAAHREVLEESGVDAAPIRQIEDVAFVVDGEDVVVRYFLMQMRQAGLASEPREQRWCSLAEAEQLLDFASARSVVRKAADIAASYPLRSTFHTGSIVKGGSNSGTPA